MASFEGESPVLSGTAGSNPTVSGDAGLIPYVNLKHLLGRAKKSVNDGDILRDDFCLRCTRGLARFSPESTQLAKFFDEASEWMCSDRAGNSSVSCRRCNKAHKTEAFVPAELVPVARALVDALCVLYAAYVQGGQDQDGVLDALVNEFRARATEWCDKYSDWRKRNNGLDPMTCSKAVLKRLGVDVPADVPRATNTAVAPANNFFPATAAAAAAAAEAPVESNDPFVAGAAAAAPVTGSNLPAGAATPPAITNGPLVAAAAAAVPIPDIDLRDIDPRLLEPFDPSLINEY